MKSQEVELNAEGAPGMPPAPETLTLEGETDQALEGIEADTDAALIAHEPEMAGLGTVQLAPESVADERAKSGVDAALAENAEAIDALRAETEAAVLAAEAGETGDAPQAEESPAQPRSPEAAATMEGFQTKRSGLFGKVLSNKFVNLGLDVTPFVGGAKMLGEALKAEEMNGRKLTGKARLIHAAVGAGSLALDIFGVGLLQKGAKLVGRSPALLRVASSRLGAKGFAKGAKVLKATSGFLMRNPHLTVQAEKFVTQNLAKGVAAVKSYQRGARPSGEAQPAEDAADRTDLPLAA